MKLVARRRDNVSADAAAQILHRGKDSLSDHVALDLGKPNLDRIRPRRIRRSCLALSSGPLRRILAVLNMAYAIDEKNAERQDLLAQMLNPLTSPVLDRIPRDSINTILDLGCGHGHTTRLLAERFPKAAAIGFEYDQALVDRARADPNNPPGISFQQGDASKLPFRIHLLILYSPATC